jgi:hypothetical protein
MTGLRVAALTAGVGADIASFSGAVHSVFTRAANIELPPARLLGLVAREVGGVPRGLQLATPPDFNFADYLRVGAPIGCRGGIVRSGDSSLSIDLRTARPWRSELRNIRMNRDDKNVARAWRTARKALDDHGGAAAFAKQAAAPVEMLFDAARTFQIGGVAGAISRLVGLGDGLTPAGDDFLVGFLAGLWSVSETPAQVALRLAMADAIAGNAARTVAISRHYLEAAIEGEVSEPLARLAAAIGSGDDGDTANAAAAALSVGASSGAAASYGLLLAARPSDPAIPPVA